MKKILLSIAMLVGFVALYSAQTSFYVCKKDGSIVEFAINEVDSIAFSKPDSIYPDPEPEPETCTPTNVANGRNNYTFTTSNANNGSEGFCYVGNGFSAINICNESLSNGNNLLGASATTDEVAVMVDLGDTYTISSVKLFQGSVNASYPDSYCSNYKVYYSVDAVNSTNKGNIGWNFIGHMTNGAIYNGAQRSSESINVTTTGDFIDFFGTYDARSVKFVFEKSACKGTGSTSGTVSILSLQVFGCEKNSTPEPEPEPDQDSTRTDMLFIGNSMTYYNTLCNIVKGIAEIKGHTNITTLAATNGGQNLIYQSTAANVLEAVQKGGYEVVVIQDIVGGFNDSKHEQGAEALISVIKQYNPDAQIIFYEPWPTKTTLTGTGSLLPYFTQTYLKTARYHGARLAPAGEAFYDIYVNSGLDYYCSDNKHPQPLGTFTSASTIYYTLYPEEAYSNFTESQHSQLNTLINKNVAYTNEGKLDSYDFATLNLILSKGYQYSHAVSAAVADKSGKTKYTSVGGEYTDLSEGMNPENLPAQTGEVVDASVFAGNMLEGLTVTASSGTASNAFDGKTNTRWESTQGVDPQWIAVDMGSAKTISKVGFIWEGAYASKYYIQTSDNGTDWTTHAYCTASSARTVQITLDKQVTTRYIRFYGISRGTTYGYSFYEMGAW